MINYINTASQFHQLNLFCTKSPIEFNTSPRIFNLLQNPKLIKLTIIDQEYINIATKSIDHFHKIRLDTSKTQIYAQSKNLPKKHEIMHENMKNNAKERVIWTYQLMERETLQEIRRKTTKNLLWSLAESKRERKSFEKFLKKWFEQVKSEFLKTLFSKFD